MKAAELKGMSLDQLDDQLAKLKKEQFNLRFQRASGQLESHLADFARSAAISRA